MILNDVFDSRFESFEFDWFDQRLIDTTFSALGKMFPIFERRNSQKVDFLIAVKGDQVLDRFGQVVTIHDRHKNI